MKKNTQKKRGGKTLGLHYSPDLEVLQGMSTCLTNIYTLSKKPHRAQSNKNNLDSLTVNTIPIGIKFAQNDVQ